MNRSAPTDDIAHAARGDYQVSGFYKFVRIAAPAGLKKALFTALSAGDLRGTILVAPEGINGTLSGKAPALRAFFTALRADPRFADLTTRDAPADGHVFQRTKVKLKREIISFRQPDADPTVRVGTYVAPKDWNALISDPNVVVLDTRNAYEVAAGTFRRAIDPGTHSFGDFAAFVRSRLDPAKHPRVAMFCTGGIRCEKASAYMLSLGFPEVYHLKGGILGYLDEVPKDDQLWDGACFVFDEREGVT